MTSKELAVIPPRELARIRDDSPVPLFDAEVKRIVTQLWDVFIDKTLAPIMKRDAVAARRTLLEELVFNLEEGKGTETMPEPWPLQEPGDEADTDPGFLLAVDQILAMDDNSWAKLDYQEKTAWVEKWVQK